MRSTRTLVATIVGGALLMTACAPESSGDQAAEAGYPTRPIELVVPYDPGGTTDLSGRVMADALSDELGVPVNVVNKPGPDQIVGVDYVRKAAPDGYTLLVDGGGSSSVQALSDNVPFAWDDRTFIGRLSAGSHVYAVAADSGYDSLSDLIKAIHRDPESFDIKWTGGTTTSDLTTLLLLKEAGVKLSDVSQVPYNSSGDTMEGVVAGDLDFGTGGAGSTFAFASSGDLRVLAQTGPEPIKQLPDVPTTKELGYSNLDLTYWIGLSGPSDLPDSVRERLEEALKTIAEDPEVIEKLANVGDAPAPMAGEEFDDYVHSEVDTFKTLRESVGEGE